MYHSTGLGSGLNIGMQPLFCTSPPSRRRSSSSPCLKSSRRASQRRTQRSSKRRSRTSAPLLRWSRRLPPHVRCIVRAEHTRTRHHRDRTYVVNPVYFTYTNGHTTASIPAGATIGRPYSLCCLSLRKRTSGSRPSHVQAR